MKTIILCMLALLAGCETVESQKESGSLQIESSGYQPSTINNLSAEDVKKVKSAYNNFAVDTAECASYFGVMYYAIEDGAAKHKPTKHDLKTVLDKAEFMFDRLLGFSMSASNDEVLNARLELFKEAILDEMKRDYSNISIIVNKYGSECGRMAESPTDHLKRSFRKEGVLHLFYKIHPVF